MAMPSIRQTHKNHDEPWIVSYADMMTLLFGFFVILNSFAVMDDRKFEEFGKQVADNLTGKPTKPVDQKNLSEVDRQVKAFRVLLSLMNPSGGVEEQMRRIEQYSAARDSRKEMKALLVDGLKDDVERLRASMPEGGVDPDSVIEVMLPEGTLFAPGRDDLLPDAATRLSGMAATIRGLGDIVSIEVVGHTDSSPPSATAHFNSNWALSSARAGTVAAVLVRSGIARDIVSVRGLADLKPLYPERDARGAVIAKNQAKNRRVAIVLRRRPAAGEKRREL